MGGLWLHSIFGFGASALFTMLNTCVICLPLWHIQFYPEILQIKVKGLQVDAAVFRGYTLNCAQTVRAPYKGKQSPCATRCLWSSSCPPFSWLMWCPVVVAGLVHLQTWTSSRLCCVTAGPFTFSSQTCAHSLPSAMLLLLTHFYSHVTCVTLT